MDGRSNLWRIDLFEPLLPPKVETRAVAIAKIGSALASRPLHQNDPTDLLDPQVALVDKLLHAFVNLVYCVAVLDLFGHKGTALQLPPMVQRGLDLFQTPYTRPIASLQAIPGGNAGYRSRWPGLHACERAARECYEMAGVGPEDVDVVELHDCFTAHELVAYEDLGFCPKGEGGRFIEEDRSDYGGDVVVNPSGGLLSKGHPIGATGVAQLVEVVWHLQGVAGERQVEGAKVGLTHNGGGFGPGMEPGAMSITVCTN